MKPVVLLLLIVSCCSCSLFKKSRFEDWSSLPKVGDQERQCLIKAVSEQQKSLNSFRGLIEATITAGRAKYDLRQIALFERPDRSRFEMLQPGLNQTASIIVTHDGELIAYSALKKVGYRGQANIENFYRLLGLPMETEELMMWLAGIVMTPGELSFHRDPENRSYLIVARDGKREIRTALDIAKEQICHNLQLKIRSLEITYDGKLLFSSQYQFRTDGEMNLETIKFYLEEVDLSGEMKLEHIGKNFDLSDKREKLFYFDLPSSAVIKQIEDLNQDNILLPAK